MGFVEMLFGVFTLYDQPERFERGGSYFIRLILERDLSNTEYMTRPIWMTNYAPGFLIPGKRGRKLAKTDALMSLPMYAKFARLRIDQIPMQRLVLDLHEPDNRSHIDFVKEALQTILDSEGLKD